MTESLKELLLDIVGLTQHFQSAKGILRQKATGTVHALDDFSLKVFRGDCLGLIGSSGCGKTVLTNTMFMHEKPTGGDVYFLGHNIGLMTQDELAPLRRRMQVIKQESFSTLDRRGSVADYIGKAYIDHYSVDKNEALVRSKLILERLGQPVALLDRNLTDLSVGQRQMMAIAAGLATDPDILFCDDPVATLDPSAQAKVINYLDGLIQKGETTILFISQDLSMVRHLANRVAVMCLGIIVEMADKDDLFNDPLHPYTQALMSAIPIADPSIEERRQRIHLNGESPSPYNVPSGCRFRTCCPIAVDRCVEEIPEERLISRGHLVRCHLVG